MRITQNSMNRTQLLGLNNSLSRLQKTQEELTSGRRLNRPSDSPVETVSAMRLRGQTKQLEQYGVNIDDAKARLASADSALMGANDMMQRVRTILVAAQNGTNGPSQRQAYAEEIRQIKDGLKQVANSSYAGRPLFGGTVYDATGNNTNAFDPSTGAWIGNESPVNRTISDAPGQAGVIDISVSGKQAFGADMFTAGGFLDSLATAVESGDSASVAAGITGMDQRKQAMSTVHSAVGAKINRLDTLTTVNGKRNDDATAALSDVENVDFVKASMDLGLQSTAYQAALAASAKLIQPSLVDFLK